MNKPVFRCLILAAILPFAVRLCGFAQTPVPEIAPGISLPNHGNVWLLDNLGDQKTLIQLKYVTVKLNPHRGANFGRSLAWPVTTKAKETVEIARPIASLRISTSSPVLYVRSILQDSEEAAQISSPGSKLALMHLQAVKDARIVDTLEFTMITGHASRETGAIDLVSEPIPGTDWIKLTISRPLDPGEYAFTWLPDQPSTFPSIVYDFGVGPGSQAKK